LVTDYVLQGRNKNHPLQGRLVKVPLWLLQSQSSAPLCTPRWWFTGWDLWLAMFKDINKMFISGISQEVTWVTHISLSWYSKGYILK
jgi:hypothetical protein